ncbi:hypothetical protein J2Q11_01160 [Tenacibaculum finnmarkense genomovar finnmarkense]|uniref:Uncharacterized protein n=1 Tax=Tenacibaculum finnmarkense genomovar finnmarkense TaxID=1458503 RepID=A0AAP1WF41_9FLAO|nr:hypothetical protein [Tenacibaculum finnmarkense]MBE7651697.1 hypothetical protein [Tenacibaculum finnmarkense genomovar finnmarkense]MBE7659499.1 hypothetical protein [Tenacibaculum finnmarkense genomovar finnmarkense]MBE7693953.1 hypothetical protein [Tenacibaculum finnmarkense genomovar finnmarkense]MCD8417025.1 hypothetical protein [Tenacibaculum finnmarkense genomovar finnmarkense]MCD8426465.1 hypothetical protein [Tenacibaculum finnmarkense genomovar finnmarkense]
MPYKPLDLSNFKIDARVASILKLGQQEYQKILGIELINDQINNEISPVTTTTKIVEVKDTETKNVEIEVEVEEGKKISEVIFDFLFEPKFDNMLTMFSKKAV